MTEPERPNSENVPVPAPEGSNGSPIPPPPPSPYAQPSVPPQAYPQATPPYGQPQQAAGQPQNPYPYQQPGQQPYYGQTPMNGSGQPPYPPYPVQPPYPAAPEPPKQRKVWPWVLVGILVVFVLGIGGCVSCVSCAILSDISDNHRYNNYNDTYDYGYGDDYDYYNYDDSDTYDYGYNGDSTFTLDYIKDMLSLSDGKMVDGAYTPGVYEVGAGKDLKPGLYYVEGNPTAELDYVVFDSTSSSKYEVDYGVTYFNNYFVELEEGEVFAWDADSDLRMYPAADASFAPEAPYQSGLYRVGTDIPAGTYTITIQTDAATKANNEPGAFVMKDLDFDDDSITDTKYIIAGGSQTVTLKDGEWFELYAATATAAS